MTPRWPRLAGIAIGLAFAGIVLLILGNARLRAMSSGPILSEHDGHIRELVIQYQPGAREIVLPVYRDFLQWLENDVIVNVVAPDQAAFDELATSVGLLHCTLRPVLVHHAMTAWSRDRWVALGPPPGGDSVTLWSPRGEAVADLWPERTGDQQIGSDLAKVLGQGVHAKRSSLFFDGGDFLADNDTVFVMPRVLKRNIQQTVKDPSELLAIFSRELQRKVVLLNEAPDHHAGMYMASVGDHVMVVADPSLGRNYFPSSPDKEKALLPDGGDFSAETQRHFDAVAAQSEAAGYRVVRMPVVPAPDGRTFLTYVNIIIDQQGAQRIVYLPFYRGADALNDAARKVWENLGYVVRPVDCTTAYRYFGALHCLVNILRRQAVLTTAA